MIIDLLDRCINTLKLIFQKCNVYCTVLHVKCIIQFYKMHTLPKPVHQINPLK